jgi:hypothetical protein
MREPKSKCSWLALLSLGFAEPESGGVLGPTALRRENVLAPASTSLMRTDRHLRGMPRVHTTGY